MTSIKEKDYQHSNTRGNGPAKRMTGGDQTDDIHINDPDSPLKKHLKKEKTAGQVNKRINNFPHPIPEFANPG